MTANKQHIVLRVFIVTFFFLGIFANLHAKNDLKYDKNSKIVKKLPSKKSVEAFQNDDDFLYDREPPQPTLYQKFMMWLSEMINELLYGSSQRSKIFNLIISIVLILALLFAIFRIMGMDIRSVIFKNREGAENAVFQEVTETIHALNYEQSITEFLKKKQYRMAVRYYYLWSLKQLDDFNYVVWSDTKTNHEIVQEIKENELRKTFFQLLLIFENVWYGKKDIDDSKFRLVESRFRNFINSFKA